MGYLSAFKVRMSSMSNRTHKDVLESLAAIKNETTFECYPSTERIAQVSCVNDRLVRIALKELEACGLISMHQSPGSRRRDFVLHLDRLPPPIFSKEESEESALQESALHKGTGSPCRKVQGTPVGKCNFPLYETTAKQGIEQGREQGTEQVSSYGAIENAPPPTDSDLEAMEALQTLFPDSEPVTTPPRAEKTKKREPEKRTASKRGTRLTLEALPPEWAQWLTREATDIDHEKAWSDFHDYWIAVPGAKGVKLDWFATFRNFARSMPAWKREQLKRTTSTADDWSGWNRV